MVSSCETRSAECEDIGQAEGARYVDTHRCVGQVAGRSEECRRRAAQCLTVKEDPTLDMEVMNTVVHGRDENRSQEQRATMNDGMTP